MSQARSEGLGEIMTTKSGLFSACAIVMFSLGCQQEPGTVFGRLAVKDSESSQVSTQDLTMMNTCKRDADNGLLNVSLSTEKQDASIEFKITGFKSSPQTYTCTQAIDNKTVGSVGGKFDTCYVAVRVPNGEGEAAPNGYSMYRDEAEKQQAYTYAGTCQIEIADVAAHVKGTVSCNKMIQTYLNGSLRNPVDTKVTADVKAEFSCALDTP